MKSCVVTIGGEAGFGIMSAGLTIAKLAARSGYTTFNYPEYPSIIRGGYNVVQVAISAEPIRAPRQAIDYLVALNLEAIKQHKTSLKPGSAVIYDADQKVAGSLLPPHVGKIAVPLNKFAKDIGGNIIMRNSVALGALTALTGGNLSALMALIDEEFSAKKKDVAALNKKCAEAGYGYILNEYEGSVSTALKPLSRRPERLIVSGNDAVALGSIAAGMQFAAVYPMTPTSNILHVLAPHQEEFGFIYKQPEDEISAITMAIGASFAGARAMVATAGGGFCLMTEGYGLAAMTETPVVIVVGMRGGPSTGLPTWTEQGDLQFVLHASQGTFPRLVLAPGDVEEAFHLTMQAYNLAEKYQGPVIILMDKHLCESPAVAAPFSYSDYRIERGKIFDKYDEKYSRYAWSADGISPRAFPGDGNHIMANSDEHNEHGYSAEGAENRVRMMKKRLQKMATCEQKDLPTPTVYGPAEADLTIVSWGSNKGVILDALEKYTNVNFLHLTWLNPFPTEFVRKFLAEAKRVAIFECNYGGQLDQLIREKTGHDIKEKWFKYDGRPFFYEEVSAKIENLLRSKISATIVGSKYSPTV